MVRDTSLHFQHARNVWGVMSAFHPPSPAARMVRESLMRGIQEGTGRAGMGRGCKVYDGRSTHFPSHLQQESGVRAPYSPSITNQQLALAWHSCFSCIRSPPSVLIERASHTPPSPLSGKSPCLVQLSSSPVRCSQSGKWLFTIALKQHGCCAPYPPTSHFFIDHSPFLSWTTSSLPPSLLLFHPSLLSLALPPLAVVHPILFACA